MGLGLNGGGMAAARFLAENGARVTVTDLRPAEVLQPSLDALKDLDIRFRLGEHKLEDFTSADLVIKNPAVSKDSPFLQAARRYETDISLFLQLSECPVLAVTGSKGKSSTVSILNHILSAHNSHTFLGGNITISPLNFLDNVTSETPVVLELSSWQLADLPDPSVLQPQISVLTNIMHDHQNKYATFQDYINDKKIIFRNQRKGQFALLPLNPLGMECSGETLAETVFFTDQDPSGLEDRNLAFITPEGGWLRFHGKTEQLFIQDLKVPGKPFLLNSLIAATAARLFGVPSETVNKAVCGFRGIEHRLEFFLEKNGIRFYNDTAATIPDAAAEAVMSFTQPVYLITGGTDKELILDPLMAVLDKPTELFLLEGTATDRMIPLLREKEIPFQGPFNALRPAVEAAWQKASPGSIILMSPGAASFGMFLNEFDRGRQFKEIANTL